MGDAVAVDQRSELFPVRRTATCPSQTDLARDTESRDADKSNAEAEKSNSAAIRKSCSKSETHVVRDDELHNETSNSDFHSQQVSGSHNKRIGREISDGSGRPDGLQELLRLAQEFESEEASKNEIRADSAGNYEESLKKKLSKENGATDTEVQTKSSFKIHLRDAEKIESKSLKSDTAMLKKFQHSTIQTRICSSAAILSKGMPKIGCKIDVNGNSNRQNASVEGDHARSAENTSPTQTNLFQRTVTVGLSRSNFTVPQPFSLATDKRASTGGRPTEGEAVGQGQKLHRLSGMIGNSSFKNMQVQKNTETKPFVFKSIRLENLKQQKGCIENGKTLKLKHDDQVHSVFTVQPESTASTEKTSNFTSIDGFNSKCEERAEKRNRFYSKLEEKLTAKEEEKIQLQAKSKEVEDEIRQLRKSLAFKATTKPGFYQESSQPKSELRKIHPTAGNTPKHGQRNRCFSSDSDGVASHSCRSISDQERSDGDCQARSVSENRERALGKCNMVDTKKSLRKSLSKPSSETLPKSKVSESVDILKLDTVLLPKVDIAPVNASANCVKTRVNCSPGTCVCPSDGKKDAGGQVEISGYDANGPIEREAIVGEVKGNNFNAYLQKIESNQVKAVPPPENDGIKVKTGRVMQEDACKAIKDMSCKVARGIKRDRLKAPAFHSLKQENAGNESLKCIMKSGYGMSPVVADVATQS